MVRNKDKAGKVFGDWMEDFCFHLQIIRIAIGNPIPKKLRNWLGMPGGVREGFYRTLHSFEI